MNFIKTIALLGVATLLLSCCSNCKQSKSGEIESLTETTWQLIQLDGTAFAAKDDAYTLRLTKDNSVSGKGDCNRLVGSYTLSDKGVLDLSKLGSTMMMCPNQAQEDKFVKQLASVDGFAIDGNLLMLLQNGEVKLTMKAVKLDK